MPSIADIESAVAESGLRVCGVASLGQGEPRSGGTIRVSPGEVATTVLLFGNVGNAFWRIFSASPEYTDGQEHPLDRWSRRIGSELAQRLGGRVLMPGDGPPFLPFLAWARSADSVAPSRLGLLIHARYGLWHAYRFAIALAGRPDGAMLEHHDDGSLNLAECCVNCVEQPCLDACPTDAFGEQTYDVDVCTRYLIDDADADCHRGGCRARVACPVGRAFRYPEAEQMFHMQAFLKARKTQRSNADSSNNRTSTVAR